MKAQMGGRIGEIAGSEFDSGNDIALEFSSNWMLRKAKWGLLREWANDESMVRQTFIVSAKAWLESAKPGNGSTRVSKTNESPQALFLDGFL